MFVLIDLVKGFAAVPLDDGRASESLPVSLVPMGLSGRVFFGGELVSE